MLVLTIIKEFLFPDLVKMKMLLQAYDKAIEANPKYDDAYYNKGTILFNLGKDEDAIQAYDKAIEANPIYINALLGKSLSLNSLNKKNDAKQLLNKVLDMDPQNPLALDIKERVGKRRLNYISI